MLAVKETELSGIDLIAKRGKLNYLKLKTKRLMIGLM